MGYSSLAPILTFHTPEPVVCSYPQPVGNEKHQLVIKYLNFKLVVQMFYV